MALENNNIAEGVLVALTTSLIQCSAKELQYLNISNNVINDEGLEFLFPALKNYTDLEHLFLSNIPQLLPEDGRALLPSWSHPTPA